MMAAAATQAVKDTIRAMTAQTRLSDPSVGTVMTARTSGRSSVTAPDFSGFCAKVSFIRSRSSARILELISSGVSSWGPTATFVFCPIFRLIDSTGFCAVPRFWRAA